MNKQQIYDACEGKISQTSIKQYSGDYVIMGKYGMIENMGEYWDIWVTGVHLGKTLSTKRVKSVLSAIKSLCRGIDTAFNNEMTAHCMDDSAIPELAIHLGARRKRQISEKQKAQQRITLAKARQKNSP